MTRDENDGPSKLQDMNLQVMKLTDQVAGHELLQDTNLYIAVILRLKIGSECISLCVI